MKIVYPDYFKSFKCSAGDCVDTCCAGWEIVVDNVSEEKYNSVSGEFGEKLRDMMTVDSDGDTIFRSQNGRCPFLNQKNLCEIYINCGESFLCTTCNMFPRFIEEFGSVREIGLGLGCPEAVKIILSQDKPWSFVSEINNEAPEPDDIDSEFYFLLNFLREKLFEIVFNKNISAESCLANIMKLTDLCQNAIDEEDYYTLRTLCDNFSADERLHITRFGHDAKEIICQFEALSEKWHGVLENLDYDTEIKYSDAFRNIAAYYIYRYFLKSVYDYDAITKIKACVFSCEIICRLCAYGLSLEDAARIYSKEAEYSAENIDILYECL